MSGVDKLLDELNEWQDNVRAILEDDEVYSNHPNLLEEAFANIMHNIEQDGKDPYSINPEKAVSKYNF